MYQVIRLKCLGKKYSLIQYTCFTTAFLCRLQALIYCVKQEFFVSVFFDWNSTGTFSKVKRYVFKALLSLSCSVYKTGHITTHYHFSIRLFIWRNKFNFNCTNFKGLNIFKSTIRFWSVYNNGGFNK